MSTRHLVDPEILPLLELLVLGEFSAETLPEIRTQTEARFEFLEPPALTPVVKRIAGPDGPLEIYWYDPAPGATGRLTSASRDDAGPALAASAPV